MTREEIEQQMEREEQKYRQRRELLERVLELLDTEDDREVPLLLKKVDGMRFFAPYLPVKQGSPGYSERFKDLIRRERAEGKGIRAIARDHGISTSTVQRYLKEV